MRIQVTGQQIDVGEALRGHVETRLAEAVGKYFEHPVDANVTFSRDGPAFVCECSVHLSSGLTTQAGATSNDVYDAFEGAVARMEKQLRRYKRRLKDHHRSRSEPIEAIMAQSYVLAGGGNESDPEPDTLQPVIIAETQTKVKSLSVGEAVMQMELTGESFLVFRNDAHGGVNVVHLREDGNIGWIDPRSENQ